ncbi:hypothetical protein [Anaerotignum sp.]|uniref:hypothetical protein n=1 Tax=Anaerotignum sp. TaxID=2039241 RepID=UPI0037352DC6
MKKMTKMFAAAMALAMAVTVTGCATQKAPETEQTNTAQAEEPNMRTVLQLGASRYEVSFRVPSDLAEYLSLTTFPEDSAAANILFTKGDQDGNIGRLVIYDAAEYDAMKNENLPLETEMLRDAENGVVLAYNGPQDSVFEPGTEEANLVQQYRNAAGDILGSLKMEKISGLPVEPNMDTVLQLGEQRYAISFSVPDNLVEYLSFEAYSEYDNAAIIQFKKGDRVGNIGSIVLYTISEYDDLKTQEVPLETEVLRDEENGFVLAYAGMQDSVFEPGTEEADLVLQYHNAVGDVLETIKVEKSA